MHLFRLTVSAISTLVFVSFGDMLVMDNINGWDFSLSNPWEVIKFSPDPPEVSISLNEFPAELRPAIAALKSDVSNDGTNLSLSGNSFDMAYPILRTADGLGYGINMRCATTTLSKTILLNAGDVVSGTAIYNTSEWWGQGGDHGWFNVSWNSYTEEIWGMDIHELHEKTSSESFPEPYEESWAWTAPVTGEYLFSFNNHMDDQAPTNIALNNIKINNTPVPEPSMAVLLFVTMALFGFVCAKRKIIDTL